MALTGSQAAAELTPALTSVTELKKYFADYLTVSTFGGDYLLQYLNTLNTVIAAGLADTALATPNLSDLTTVQVPAGLVAVNAALAYYNKFLTVFTFGGDYLFQRLTNIKTHLTTIATG